MPRYTSMVILDANMILRFLLNDNTEMAIEARQYISTGKAFVTIEVVAEVVYVLKGVYRLDRKMISNALLRFLPLVGCQNEDVLKLGLETFAAENLDFVDCVLYAYHRVDNAQIATFDQKLLKLLKS